MASVRCEAGWVMEDTENREQEDREHEVSLRCEAGRWVGGRRTCRGKLFRIFSPYGRAFVVHFPPFHVLIPR